MSSEMRELVKEMREALEGVVRVADRNTVEFDRARAAIAKAAPAVFANTGDSEAQFIADGESLNCPSCGGSGHVEDALLARTEAGAGGEATNPDNVGGLLPCPFCGEPAEMTSRTGGQAVAFSEVYMANCSQCGVNHEIWEGEDEATARWNRRPELCRAAPAGGDETKGDWDDWFKAWAKARGMTMQQTADGRFLCPDTSLAQKAHEAGCMVSHMYYLELCRQEELAKDSAPAGSGEVDEDIDGLCRSLEFMAEHSDSVGFNSDAECLRKAAALLRKLQQGAGGWRPIESAPKDCRVFLYSPAEGIGAGRFDGQFWTLESEPQPAGGWQLSGYFADEPSHWQPLPEPPASQGQEGGK